jgi:Lipocalin-like domain
MSLLSRRTIGAAVCLIAFLCASCITTTLPKSASVEPTPSSGGTSHASAADKNLLDTWELLYQVDEKGDQERPKEGTRTLIEFTDKGQVIFNRMDKDNSDKMKSRTGKYVVDNNGITITDDVGNTVKWPYQVTADTLVITMPEINKKFFWRRFR